MYVPNKLTDTEWASVEYISKEFAYWQRASNDKLEVYSLPVKDLSKLLSIITRLSKGEPVGCEGCGFYVEGITGESMFYQPCGSCKRCMGDHYQQKKPQEEHYNE